ncbi:helix-turn-helix transcriptional regulator [Streptomyces sp. TG1A-8]|uniref:helix-turn-helix domain-containing protein n=1 Tax=Streptomyces sp. TG1A-8 TaxID=3051385 RepID=UPI00265C754D|nr:helix-turn-helix transcriptional regulator [Streptomyces sp. TG1A-8]MDO0926639.1 helix-turn-helix transcriptional regulator [Streptomyces sp. TG1A-8]
MAGDEFSELLGRLKKRSGLSYGVLGKRLHTSASTLHRYVNGDAVPVDYAPVERFARVCRATPEELVELHRRWVLADARRGQKAGGAPAEEEPRVRTAAETGTGAAETGTGTARAGTEQAGTGTARAGTEAAQAGTGTARAGTEAAQAGTGTARAGTEAAQAGTEAAETAAAAGAGSGGGRWSLPKAPAARRRAAVLAGAAVAAVLVPAALVVRLAPGGSGDDRDGKPVAGTASRSAGPVGESPGASRPAGARGGPVPPSASRGGGPTDSASASASASVSRGGAAGAVRGGGSGDGATAPAVAVNPYKWEGPCSQHYLVDRKPEQVPPPPAEPDARGWVTALGGVAGGQQMLALTVQGTGRATVVLEELHVRVVGKSAPLAWNDFVMGVGCGGDVGTAAFGVDLDAGRPVVSPGTGQRDFPYKVSESDPEVFYVFANARAHDVSWYLELDWSSGDRRGTVRVDDGGRPFRTSGNAGRPAYTQPLGASEWGRDEYDPVVPG